MQDACRDMREARVGMPPNPSIRRCPTVPPPYILPLRGTAERGRICWLVPQYGTRVGQVMILFSLAGGEGAGFVACPILVPFSGINGTGVFYCGKRVSHS